MMGYSVTPVLAGSNARSSGPLEDDGEEKRGDVRRSKGRNKDA